MHELSICQSISEVVQRAAQGRSVATIHLDIGKMRQVVPATLAYCWDLVASGGPLDGSKLAVQHLAIELHCSDCQKATTVGEKPVIRCGHCESGEVDIVRGNEFLITTLDLRD